MRTEELIRLMAEDASGVARLRPAVLSAMAGGAVFSALLLVLTLGLREDMAVMLFSPRVAFKLAATLLLAGLACRLALLAGRPDVALAREARVLLLPALVLGAAVLTELAVLAPGVRMQSLIGAHAGFCLFFIPVLSAVPLAALLAMMRRGAPGNPAGAGAVAGLTAGSIAAAIYAWHCTDDSPLFVATWYLLAIALVASAGAAAGVRLLRW